MKINSYKQVEKIWMDSRNVLKNFIFKKTRDTALAEELTHEVLIKLYHACCSDREIKNIRSWLFQIAQNTTVDHWKDQSRFQYEIFDKVDENDDPSAMRDLSEFIEPLISFLPEKYAIPLRMSDLEGMKQADIAQQLNLGLSATKSRIQRARELLRQEIISCCHLEIDPQGGISDFSIKESCTPLQKIKKNK